MTTGLDMTAEVGELRLATAMDVVLENTTVEPDWSGASVRGIPVAGAGKAKLRHELAAALYREFHAGLSAQRPVRRRRLGERGDRGNGEWEADLAACVPHQYSPERAQVLQRMPSAAQVIVEGVRVIVPTARLQEVADGQNVLLPAVRPNLSPGFFVANGSRGHGAERGPLLRLYAHVTCKSAGLELWRRAVGTLEEIGVPYRVKITSDIDEFGRRDGFVAYLGRDAWSALDALAAGLDSSGATGSEIPVFAKRLYPGIASAWDPQDARPGWSGLSFGQHRCRAVADGLLAHAADGSLGGDGEGVSSDVRERVRDSFRAAGIDPLSPDRNVHSPTHQQRESAHESVSDVLRLPDLHKHVGAGGGSERHR